MKRFIAVIMLCVVLTLALPIFVFAESGESSAETSAPGAAATMPNESTPSFEFSTDALLAWLKNNAEEISVILGLIIMSLWQFIKNKALNKSITTLNNNAVSVAENSNTAIGDALAGVNLAAAVVDGFKTEIYNLLLEVRANEEEKQKLAATLASLERYFATARGANLELANEVAELLVLANIPNSKKEELYARHRAAVAAIVAAENPEVNEDDTKVA